MHARSSTHGNGMWKSTDAGKTWTKIGLEKSYFIPKVEVDSKNPDIVYVAAEGKLYDNEMDCERGLFKSIDGGKTWTNLGPMKDRGVADFVIDPRNSNVIIAASYKTFRRAWTYIDRQPGNELYKTTDGGKTWTKLTSGLPQGVALGRTGLAIFEKNPNIVYARVDEEVNLGFQERDGVANFRAAAAGGPAAAGAAASAARPASGRTRRSRAVQGVQDRPAVRQGCRAQVHAGRRRRTRPSCVTKLNEAIGDKDFLTKNGIDVAKFVPGGAQDVRDGRGDDGDARRGREAGEEAGGGRRFDRGQGAIADRQPPRARDALRGRRSANLAAAEADTAWSTAATTRARPGRR